MRSLEPKVITLLQAAGLATIDLHVYDGNPVDRVALPLSVEKMRFPSRG